MKRPVRIILIVIGRREFLRRNDHDRMSALGEEFLNPFGEFLEFDTVTKDDHEYHEDFVDWIRLADIDPTHTPIFAQIQQSMIQRTQQ
jgi:hypothetical protein